MQVIIYNDIENLKKIVNNSESYNQCEEAWINNSSHSPSPLFLAVQRNLVEIAEYLMSIGANVHKADTYKNSMLHVAQSPGDD